MNKLILLLLFIPIISYSQETRPSFAIKTIKGDYLNDYKIQYPAGFIVQANSKWPNTYMKFLKNPIRRHMIRVMASNIKDTPLDNIEKLVKEGSVVPGELLSTKKFNNKGYAFTNQKYLSENNEAFLVSIFNNDDYLFTIFITNTLHPDEKLNEELLEKMFKECTELLDEMINNFV